MQFHAISIMCNNNIYESIIIHHLTTCILRQEPSCSHVRWGCCEGLFIGVAAGRWPCSRRQNGWRGFRFRYIRCVEMMQWPFDSRTLDAAMRLRACVCVCVTLGIRFVDYFLQPSYNPLWCFSGGKDAQSKRWKAAQQLRLTSHQNIVHTHMSFLHQLILLLAGIIAIIIPHQEVCQVRPSSIQVATLRSWSSPHWGGFIAKP